jgi:hypothetical protein
MQEADDGGRRLLRTRSERPRDRRTADQCDELAPLHVSPIKGHVLCKA